MRVYYYLLVVGMFLLTACHEEENQEQISELETSEYFNVEVDGEAYETTDPASIGGTVYPSYDSGVINFDFSGEIKGEYSQDDIYRGFFFKVCFYDGAGTYYTGTDQTVSWAFNWFNDQLWENHYNYGNSPGVVIITKASDQFVEGTFEYEAYNPDLETEILVNGEFGLELESFEDYQSH